MDMKPTSLDDKWICCDCGSYNPSYQKSKKCAVCGEEISAEDEAPILYKMATSLYNEVKAVSADELSTVAECFSKVLACFSKVEFSKVKDSKKAEELKWIRMDSQKKCESCKREAEKIIFNEKTYKEAVEHWESACELDRLEAWADAREEYYLARELFEQIYFFKDAEERAHSCQNAGNTAHEKAVYYQAKEFFAEAVALDSYKIAEEFYEKAAKLYDAIPQFADAKVRRDECLKCIEEIKIEQQYQTILAQKEIAEEETDLDGKAELYKKLISDFEESVLSDRAKKAVEQCKLLLDECLKQIEDCRIQELFKKASVQYETVDRLTDYLLRADAFSEMLNEYEKDAKTDEFVKLIGKCRNKLEDANRYLSYDKAVALMGKAEREGEFRKAADIFLALTGFKDSAEKGRICTEHADKCLRQANYNSAIKKINQAKKITLFNWRSYR